MTPAHVEAERNLLAAVLVSPELLPGCALEQGDFAVPTHRAVWRALRRLDEAGSPVDAVAVKAELEKRHELTGVAELLGELVRGAPRVESTASWEAVIREQARRRAVEAAGSRMVAMARNGDAPEDALEEGLKILTEAATFVGSTVDLDTAAHVNAAVAALEARATDTHAAGWSTGLPSLDAHLGRLQPGQSIVIAARTGEGKSTLLANVGDAIAAQGGRVLLFSAEMTRAEVMTRRLIAEAGVPASHFQAGGVTPLPGDWEAIAKAAGALAHRPFFIEASSPTPLQARAKARFVKARRGARRGAVRLPATVPARTGAQGRDTRSRSRASVARVQAARDGSRRRRDRRVPVEPKP